MNLYLLRHAIAVERGTPGAEDDSLRELTPKGAAKMRRIARGMLALELGFDLILSNPYLRTRQTADIVAEVFDARQVLRFTDSLIPGVSGEQIVSEINKQYRKRENILLVGHEPTLSSLIATLLAGDPKDMRLAVEGVQSGDPQVLGVRRERAGVSVARGHSCAVPT